MVHFGIPYEQQPKHVPNPLMKAAADVVPWLSPNLDRYRHFQSYCDDGDAAKAWLTLTSVGWKLSKVKECLPGLRPFATDATYDHQIEHWLEFATDENFSI